MSLMIPETFQEDAGKYMCKATNVGGSAASSAELIVRGKTCSIITNISARQFSIRKLDVLPYWEILVSKQDES